MGQKRSNDKILNEIKQLKEELKLLKNLLPSKSDLAKAKGASETRPELIGNQPNPFDQFTIIQYFVPETGHQRISLFIVDEKGDQRMFWDHLKEGKQKLLLKDHALRPGIYFCSLVVEGNIVETRKMEVTRQTTR